MLQDYFEIAAQGLALIVQAIAIVVVMVGAVEAAVQSLRNVVWTAAPSLTQRAIWLRFAGWILLALEFALGADVIGTAIAPTWDEIGKLGAIATIRTALSFFLARDFEDARRLSAGGTRSDS